MTSPTIALMLATLGACYSPTFQDCELACTGTGATACPDGLSCESGVCRLAGMTGACGGAEIDAPPMKCWPFPASNFNPCAADFPPSLGPLAMTTQTIDTTNPTLGVLYDNRYVVVHADSIDIPNGVTVTVTGSRPLILVSDGTVTITGQLLVAPTQAVPGECTTLPPPVTNTGASGGPGGGYGTLGGSGGTAPGIGKTPGGVVSGEPMLVPLRAGCPGGRGAGPYMPQIGGDAGGALQISTKTQLIVGGGGTIIAGGGGGRGGRYGTCGGTGCTSSGGGGGTGGSILLEGDLVEIKNMARVCAPGGAGGNGAFTSSMTIGGDGLDAVLCSGGLTGSGGSRGGTGASVDATPGGPGSDASNGSGGGGGGGLGRIRVHSNMTTVISGTVMPAPTF